MQANQFESRYKILTPTEIGFQLLILNFRKIFHILFACNVQFLVATTMELLIDFSKRKCYPKCDSIWVTFGGACSSILYIYSNNSSFRMANTRMVKLRKATNMLRWLLTNWNDATGCDIVWNRIFMQHTMERTIKRKCDGEDKRTAWK